MAFHGWWCETSDVWRFRDGGVKRVKPKLTKMHETQKVYSEKLKSKMENQSGEALPESDKKEC